MSAARVAPRQILIGLAGLLCLAATPAPTVDQEATVVQELVVTAPDRGPAWWRVSSPTSTVYVMGVPGGLPKGMTWDMALRRTCGRDSRPPAPSSAMIPMPTPAGFRSSPACR